MSRASDMDKDERSAYRDYLMEKLDMAVLYEQYPYDNGEDSFISDAKDMLMQIKDKRAQEILLAQIKALAGLGK